MDKSDRRADKTSFVVDRAMVTCREPQGQPREVNKWRVTEVEERYFYFDTEEDARGFVRILGEQQDD